jgi:hypothetical protein
MSKQNPLERLLQAKTKATNEHADRENFRSFVETLPESDAREYTENIRVLMGTDDAAALALFPESLYATAEAARAGARLFWKERSARGY